MNKKTGIAIGIGAGILALACGVIALSKLDQMNKAERELKKATRKVKKKTQKIADMAKEKAEEVFD